MKEEEIIKLCIKKDKKATELFYKQYYAYLYKICYIYLRNEDDSKDAVSMSYMKIFNNLSMYDTSFGTIRSWIRKIAVNVCLDMIKRIKKFPKENIENEYQSHFVQGNDFNNKLQLENVIGYIESLGSPMKEIIKLFTLEGYSHQEIAKMLDISETYSRFLLSKGRKLLQIEFKEENIYEK